MSNSRFYHALPIQVGNTIQLSDNATTHATRVLRLEVSDEIVLFNGDGFDYVCAIISIQKNKALVIVKSCITLKNESPLHITLLQGISSGERMDYTVQKAVELGAAAIVPIFTQRSVVKLSTERAEKRQEHWQNIVRSACEQSGRAVVPEVFAPVHLTAWLADTLSLKSGHESYGAGNLSSVNLAKINFNNIDSKNNSPTRILLNPVGAKRLADMPKPTGNIELLIGAEGGLSQAEIDTALSQGFQSVILGKRILRTETAALTAIAAMQTLWGDF